jgi:hypothetical protein
MRARSSPRSRRATVPVTPGASYVPWNGPNFTMQTNFTGQVFAPAVETDSPNPATIGPAINVLSLNVADGDVLYIRVGLRFSATHTGGATGFSFLLLDTDDAGAIIGDVSVPEGEDYYLDAEIFLPVSGTLYGVGGILSAVGSNAGLTKILSPAWDFENLTPKNLRIEMQINQPENEVRLLYGICTRIRPGL